jgi:hypothetical protein
MASTAGTVQVGETPLFVAAEAGHVEALRLLADVGANMHHTTPTGDTPLRVAARQGHGDCVRFLLRRGVKPTRADLEQCVAHAEHPGALIELLAHGCTVDSALFALLPKGLADHPLMTLGKNTPKFVVLWQAGASLNNVSLTPLATALARIAGALPAVQCVRGERCHDESERHEQLFYHERRHDREKRLASVMAEFVVSLAQRGLSLVDDRAVQVLFGLQPLDLPALVSTTIVDCACPLATMLPMHLKWRLVTLIKHFKSKSTTEK